MITFVSVNDWANLGFHYSQAMRAVGVDSISIALRPHPFRYYKQSLVMGDKEYLQAVISKTDTLVIMHSQGECTQLPEIDYPDDIRFAVHHGGTAYRENHKELNERFNRIVDVSLVQTGDLLGLGAKNEKWIPPTTDLRTIMKFSGYQEGRSFVETYHPYKIAHFPRGADIKGTQQINETMDLLAQKGGFFYIVDPKEVKWEDNIQRMANCDIYINSIATEIKGKPYGGGVEVTDIEAAALGKVVVTHFTKKKQFEELFGECPFVAVNNANQLRKAIVELLNMSPEEITSLKEETFEWFQSTAAYEPMGETLMEALE